MKRVAAIVVLVFLAGFALYEFGTVAVCDGWYDLTVEIDAGSAANVSRVSFLPVNRSELADAIVGSIDGHLRFMEHRDSTDPFPVNVGFSFRASNLGRTWGHVQEYSHVIVVLHHEDGSREVHRLVVPHRDESRRIVVTTTSAT